VAKTWGQQGKAEEGERPPLEAVAMKAEGTADREVSVCAVVNCRTCERATALQRCLITSHKSPSVV
jgi:hypothetical protein